VIYSDAACLFSTHPNLENITHFQLKCEMAEINTILQQKYMRMTIKSTARSAQESETVVPKMSVKSDAPDHVLTYSFDIHREITLNGPKNAAITFAADLQMYVSKSPRFCVLA